MRSALGLLLLLAAMPTVADTLYRWVDNQGKVHFTDQPPVPNSAKKVEEVKVSRSLPGDPALPYALQQAIKAHPVVLYATVQCAPCKEGRALLDKRGIPYTEKDPQKSTQVLEELQKLHGKVEVPVLVVGKAPPVPGYEEGSWTSLLDSAGYPKTGVSPRQRAKPAETAEDKPAPPALPGTPASPEAAPSRQP